MYECGTCWKGFPAGWHAREQHCRATGHCRPDFECEECGDGFDDEDGHWGHMVQYNHFEFECSQCGETWPTEQQRQEHERDEHLYCDECDRFFNNRNNLKMVRHHTTYGIFPVRDFQLILLPSLAPQLSQTSRTKYPVPFLQRDLYHRDWHGPPRRVKCLPPGP